MNLIFGKENENDDLLLVSSYRHGSDHSQRLLFRHVIHLPDIPANRMSVSAPRAAKVS